MVSETTLRALFTQGALVKKIGKTTYVVRVHFSEARDSERARLEKKEDLW
ncbi:MAG: hypothetical protein J6C33_06065 [Lachnospiraceae bacterium]|nr:hypothetical protein [Lachnospiraceae bacterium]